MVMQKSAEGIVGRGFDPAEGPNMTVGLWRLSVHRHGGVEDGQGSCRDRR